jgi:hypothetical protein
MKFLSNEVQTIDIGQLILRLQQQYNSVYTYQFDDQVFIYRPVGRKEYKRLYLSDQWDDISKEEMLCTMCTLYPENYDFENCEEAGLPSALADQIIKNSYLSTERREKVLEYFRQEMYDLDNQMTCIIMEAFPDLEIESVENWDIETTCKYYSRAEWILHNLRGVPIREKKPEETFYGAPEEMRPQTTEIDPDTLKSTASESPVDHNGNPKVKPGNTQLTPEKLRELKQRFPDIDWEHDDGLRGTTGLTDQPDIDVDTPALRTPSQWRKLKQSEAPGLNAKRNN